MKKKSEDEKAEELREEYDLGELLKEGVQGKYAERFREGTTWFCWTGMSPKLFRRTKP